MGVAAGDGIHFDGVRLDSWPDRRVVGQGAGDGAVHQTAGVTKGQIACLFQQEINAKGSRVATCLKCRQFDDGAEVRRPDRETHLGHVGLVVPGREVFRRANVFDQAGEAAVAHLKHVQAADPISALTAPTSAWTMATPVPGGSRVPAHGRQMVGVTPSGGSAPSTREQTTEVNGSSPQPSPSP